MKKPAHRMKKSTRAVWAGCLLCLSAMPLFAQPIRLPLWPDGAPGESCVATNPPPFITIYEPPAELRSGTAVVICPGGGYAFVALKHEGEAIAEWMNGLGISAAVLKYRVGRGGGHPAPLQDAQRALRMMRARAEDMRIAPDRIGIMGFSAGGHLAATAGTHFDAGDPQAADPVERVGCRPDFMILGYPVIALGEPFTHRGSQINLIGPRPSTNLVTELSAEKQVTKNTPPTFLFHTHEDNGVPPDNSIVFYQALRRAGVPAELHIYQNGGHGAGLARNIAGTSDWPQACEHWLQVRGLLPDQPGRK